MSASLRDRFRQQTYARISLDASAPGTAATPLRPDEDVAGVTELCVDHIDLYDGNPRVERNEAYEEIRASIRARGGLTTRLTVTRRPGTQRYMIAAGGNTRLAILKELWQETGDARFGYQQVLVEPWVSESHVYAAHLIENTKRAEMVFWDRATSHRNLKLKIETETGEKLSQRRIVEVFAERGVGTSRSMVQLYEYSVDYLRPVGPLLSNNSAKALQPMLNEQVQLASRFGIDADALYAEILWPAMDVYAAQVQTPEAFSPRALVDLVARDLAQRLGVTDVQLRGWLDAVRLDGSVTAEALRASLESPRERPAAPPSPPAASGSIRPALEEPEGDDAGDANSAPPVHQHAATDGGGVADGGQAGSNIAWLHGTGTASTDGAAPPADDRCDDGPDDGVPEAAVPAAVPAAGPGERQGCAAIPPSTPDPGPGRDPSGRVLALAQTLADAAGVGHCLVPCGTAPAGFYVEPLSGADPADPYLREAAWWALAQLSGQLYPMVARQLPEQSAWRTAFIACGEDALADPVEAMLRDLNAHYDLATRQPMIFADYLPVLMLHEAGTGALLVELMQGIRTLRDLMPARFAFARDFLFLRKEG